MGNYDLNTVKANKMMFDKLIKNTEKKFRFSFKSATVDKIYDEFIADSERLIQPIELSYKKHEQEIYEAKRMIKEIVPIEKILEDVKKQRNDLIKKLRKWSTKNNMVYCKLFESELQKLINRKDYSLDGINFLWNIYDMHKDEMKKELANDKTNFLDALCKKLLKPYGFEFRRKNENAIFEEKVQRLHNCLKDLSSK